MPNTMVGVAAVLYYPRNGVIFTPSRLLQFHLEVFSVGCRGSGRFIGAVDVEGVQ